MTKKRLLTLTLAAALFLIACGIKGELETPPPVWGEGNGSATLVTPTQPSKTQ